MRLAVGCQDVRRDARRYGLRLGDSFRSIAPGQRFPAEHASFADAIGALKDAAPLDPAQVQRLKALGYL